MVWNLLQIRFELYYYVSNYLDWMVSDDFDVQIEDEDAFFYFVIVVLSYYDNDYTVM